MEPSRSQWAGLARGQWAGLIFNVFLWAFIAVLQTFQNYTGKIAEGQVPDLQYMLVLQLFTWLPWALLTPLLFLVYRQWPIVRLVSFRTLLFLPLIGTGCILFEVACHTLGMQLKPGGGVHSSSFWIDFPPMVRWLAFPGVLVFAAIVGASHAVGYYRKFREREVRALALENELSRARLLAMNMQIQPHFFFNSLHTIASLVRDKQNDAAVNVIARLGDLFRYVLDRTGTQVVPLEQELEFLKGYLEIEQTRFSDRLEVVLEIAPDTLHAEVPTLLLQPIVENAIRHGIAHLTNRGEVRISSRRLGEVLLIEVSNEGRGLACDWEKKAESAVGIRNTRNRIHQLHGNHTGFELREADRGRVVASLSIPFRENGVDLHRDSS